MTSETTITQKIGEIITIASMKVYNKQVKLCDALEEMEKEINTSIENWLKTYRFSKPIVELDGVDTIQELLGDFKNEF